MTNTDGTGSNQLPVPAIFPKDTNVPIPHIAPQETSTSASSKDGRTPDRLMPEVKCLRDAHHGWATFVSKRRFKHVCTCAITPNSKLECQNTDLPKACFLACPDLVSVRVLGALEVKFQGAKLVCQVLNVSPASYPQSFAKVPL